MIWKNTTILLLVKTIYNCVFYLSYCVSITYDIRQWHFRLRHTLIRLRYTLKLSIHRYINHIIRYFRLLAILIKCLFQSVIFNLLDLTHWKIQSVIPFFLFLHFCFTFICLHPPKSILAIINNFFNQKAILPLTTACSFTICLQFIVY